MSTEDLRISDLGDSDWQGPGPVAEAQPPAHLNDSRLPVFPSQNFRPARARAPALGRFGQARNKDVRTGGTARDSQPRHFQTFL